MVIDFVIASYHIFVCEGTTKGVRCTNESFKNPKILLIYK